ncbi:MAG TPA: M56 family metallopeptidase [Thermoanaerobaculia bacterium]|nr:M56 family metallopeptidase [Thermoanaerobaculia bacterium]
MFENLMAWLMTYALHSTLFLFLALLVSRRLSSRWARLEEAMWRFALVAALATATVQLAAGWEPVAGRWALNAPASSMEAPAPVRLAPTPEPLRAMATAPAPAGVPSSPAGPALPSWPFDLRSTVLGLWAFGALLLGLHWGWSYLRLKRRLRARPEVVGGGMFSLLHQLTGELGGTTPLVRLTCSSRVSVPVALGLGWPEICVPPRALSHLEPEQQQGMLAHELAHLVRRDPFWLAFSRILAGVLFFQPLNWVACRRLRELSERLCDEWAVERTGRPLSLARCLAEVAGWSIRPSAAIAGLPVPSMADRPSNLAQRIRHLLDDDSRSSGRRVRPVWLAVAMVVLLAGVAAVAPGVYAAVAPAGSPEEPREPAALADVQEPTEPIDPVEPEEPDYEILEDLGDEIDAEIEEELEAALAGLEDLEDLEGLAELGDFDFNFDFDALSGIDVSQIEAMAEISGKYAEEYAVLAESMAERLEPELERISEEVNRELGPEIERISEEVNRKLAPEIERISEEVNRELAPEIERISERVANELEPEIRRLQAEADRLRREGGLSEQERERIRREAREISRRARPSEEEMKAIRDTQRKHREEMQKFMADHREEMEAVRKEALAHSEAMREQIRLRMEADPKYRELRERHRSDMEGIRERHREEMNRHRERLREDRERSRRIDEKEEKEEKEKEKSKERQKEKDKPA